MNEKEMKKAWQFRLVIFEEVKTSLFLYVVHCTTLQRHSLCQYLCMGVIQTILFFLSFTAFFLPLCFLFYFYDRFKVFCLCLIFLFFVAQWSVNHHYILMFIYFLSFFYAVTRCQEVLCSFCVVNSFFVFRLLFYDFNRLILFLFMKSTEISGSIGYIEMIRKCKAATAKIHKLHETFKKQSFTEFMR